MVQIPIIGIKKLFFCQVVGLIVDATYSLSQVGRGGSDAYREWTSAEDGPKPVYGVEGDFIALKSFVQQIGG